MNAWWQQWRQLLSSADCARIVKDGLTLPPIVATVGEGDTSRTDRQLRRSVVRWVPVEWGIVQKIDGLIRWANTVAFGFDLSCLREVQFTEYLAEDEAHYDWHEDIFWTSGHAYHRKLSAVVQLSDPADYDGGNLELDRDQPAEGFRGQGTVVVFPSFLKHRVTPVTRGYRYSLVAWYDGPRFR